MKSNYPPHKSQRKQITIYSSIDFIHQVSALRCEHGEELISELYSDLSCLEACKIIQKLKRISYIIGDSAKSNEELCDGNELKF